MEIQQSLLNIITEYQKEDQCAEKNIQNMLNKLLLVIMTMPFLDNNILKYLQEQRLDIITIMNHNNLTDEQITGLSKLLDAYTEVINLYKYSGKHQYEIRFTNCNYKNQNFVEVLHPLYNATYPVAQFDMDGNYIRTYKSVNDAARQLHCGATSIRKVLKGKEERHMGVYGNTTA